ncbi:hypothetical protein QLX08_006198 [Tetragonisca angustula]|uniref:Uncharacterized protein n=1 Tax=Tetragonisca angustula TaxID=166442 RepID=A0AAW0ZUE9_9HYME
MHREDSFGSRLEDFYLPSSIYVMTNCPRGRRRTETTSQSRREKDGNRVKRRPGPDGGVMERGRRRKKAEKEKDYGWKEEDGATEGEHERRVPGSMGPT